MLSNEPILLETQNNDESMKDLHELLFTNSKLDNNQEISYLYSSLYCLTNNNFLLEHFKSLTSDNKDVQSFYEMIINIWSDMKDKKVSKSFQAIKDYQKSIILEFLLRIY